MINFCVIFERTVLTIIFGGSIYFFADFLTMYDVSISYKSFFCLLIVYTIAHLLSMLRETLNSINYSVFQKIKKKQISSYALNKNISKKSNNNKYLKIDSLIDTNTVFMHQDFNINYKDYYTYDTKKNEYDSIVVENGGKKQRMLDHGIEEKETSLKVQKDSKKINSNTSNYLSERKKKKKKAKNKENAEKNMYMLDNKDDKQTDFFFKYKQRLLKKEDKIIKYIEMDGMVDFEEDSVYEQEQSCITARRNKCFYENKEKIIETQNKVDEKKKKTNKLKSFEHNTKDLKTENEFYKTGNTEFANFPSNDKPSNDKPSGDKPSNDKPSGDKLSSYKPSGDKLSSYKPSGDKPSGDKPNNDKPSGDKLSSYKPSGDKLNSYSPNDKKKYHCITLNNIYGKNKNINKEESKVYFKQISEVNKYQVHSYYERKRNIKRDAEYARLYILFLKFIIKVKVIFLNFCINNPFLIVDLILTTFLNIAWLKVHWYFARYKNKKNSGMFNWNTNYIPKFYVTIEGYLQYMIIYDLSIRFLLFLTTNRIISLWFLVNLLNTPFLYILVSIITKEKYRRFGWLFLSSPLRFSNFLRIENFFVHNYNYTKLNNPIINLSLKIIVIIYTYACINFLIEQPCRGNYELYDYVFSSMQTVTTAALGNGTCFPFSLESKIVHMFYIFMAFTYIHYKIRYLKNHMIETKQLYGNIPNISSRYFVIIGHINPLTLYVIINELLSAYVKLDEIIILTSLSAKFYLNIVRFLNIRGPCKINLILYDINKPFPLKIKTIILYSNGILICNNIINAHHNIHNDMETIKRYNEVTLLGPSNKYISIFLNNMCNNNLLLKRKYTNIICIHDLKMKLFAKTINNCPGMFLLTLVLFINVPQKIKYKYSYLLSKYFNNIKYVLQSHIQNTDMYNHCYTHYNREQTKKNTTNPLIHNYKQKKKDPYSFKKQKSQTNLNSKLLSFFKFKKNKIYSKQSYTEKKKKKKNYERGNNYISVDQTKTGDKDFYTINLNGNLSIPPVVGDQSGVPTAGSGVPTVTNTTATTTGRCNAYYNINEDINEYVNGDVNDDISGDVNGSIIDSINSNDHKCNNIDTPYKKEALKKNKKKKISLHESFFFQKKKKKKKKLFKKYISSYYFYKTLCYSYYNNYLNYIKGIKYNIYKIKLPTSFLNMHFVTIVQYMYMHYNAFVIGIINQHNEIKLNPLNFIYICVDTCFILLTDKYNILQKIQNIKKIKLDWVNNINEISVKKVYTKKDTARKYSSTSNDGSTNRSSSCTDSRSCNDGSNEGSSNNSSYSSSNSNSSNSSYSSSNSNSSNSSNDSSICNNMTSDSGNRNRTNYNAHQELNKLLEENRNITFNPVLNIFRVDNYLQAIKIFKLKNKTLHMNWERERPLSHNMGHPQNLLRHMTDKNMFLNFNQVNNKDDGSNHFNECNKERCKKKVYTTEDGDGDRDEDGDGDGDRDEDGDEEEKDDMLFERLNKKKKKRIKSNSNKFVLMIHWPKSLNAFLNTLCNKKNVNVIILSDQIPSYIYNNNLLNYNICYIQKSPLTKLNLIAAGILECKQCIILKNYLKLNTHDNIIFYNDKIKSINYFEYMCEHNDNDLILIFNNIRNILKNRDIDKTRLSYYLSPNNDNNSYDNYFKKYNKTFVMVKNGRVEEEKRASGSNSQHRCKSHHNRNNQQERRKQKNIYLLIELNNALSMQYLNNDIYINVDISKDKYKKYINKKNKNLSFLENYKKQIQFFKYGNLLKENIYKKIEHIFIYNYYYYLYFLQFASANIFTHNLLYHFVAYTLPAKNNSLNISIIEAFINGTYADVKQKLKTDLSLKKIHPKYHTMNFLVLFQDFLSKGAIIIGIYRHCKENNMNIVIPCPQRSFIMHKWDKVYVLQSVYIAS
ncbi:conserved membrane protein, unknown function [Hepatocystis sp. ex Piliocolobus tephrosceles]|nr:conserved membrane protein, unknown function [Hepatocystis sp. ex Piliocolobus tephrosceles]